MISDVIRLLKDSSPVLAVNTVSLSLSWTQFLEGGYRVGQFLLVLASLTFTLYMIRKTRLEIRKLQSNEKSPPTSGSDSPSNGVSSAP